MVWQTRLKEIGLSENPKWANELFSDFFSFNAFGLIFFMYLLFASFATVLADLGHPKQKLEQIVSHMESRLAQIASSIVAFMVGLLALVLIYSVLNLDSGGLKLAGLTIVFSFFIAASFVMALLVGRRTKPFNKWWVALLSTFILTCVLWWLLTQSGK